MKRLLWVALLVPALAMAQGTIILPVGNGPGGGAGSGAPAYVGDTTTTATWYNDDWSGTYTVQKSDAAIIMYVVGVDTLTGATFGGSSMTLIEAHGEVYAYGILSQSTGTKQIVGDIPAAGNYTYCVVEYENVSSFGTTGQSSQGWGTTISTTISSSTGRLIVDATGWYGQLTATADGGQTVRVDRDNVNHYCVMVSEEASAASNTLGWTLSGDAAFAHIVIELVP